MAAKDLHPPSSCRGRRSDSSVVYGLCNSLCNSGRYHLCNVWSGFSAISGSPITVTPRSSMVIEFLPTTSLMLVLALSVILPASTDAVRNVDDSPPRLSSLLTSEASPLSSPPVQAERDHKTRHGYNGFSEERPWPPLNWKSRRVLNDLRTICRLLFSEREDVRPFSEAQD